MQPHPMWDYSAPRGIVPSKGCVIEFTVMVETGFDHSQSPGVARVLVCRGRVLAREESTKMRSGVPLLGSEDLFLTVDYHGGVPWLSRETLRLRGDYIVLFHLLRFTYLLRLLA